MTLNGVGKHLRVVGIYVGLVASGAVASWVANEALTADDGLLMPAEARRQLRALAGITERQALTLTAHTAEIANVNQEVASMRAEVTDIQQTTTAILRVVCLDPTFARSIECRKVYR